jgi:hypothetical protein
MATEQHAHTIGTLSSVDVPWKVKVVSLFASSTGRSALAIVHATIATGISKLKVPDV